MKGVLLYPFGPKISLCGILSSIEGAAGLIEFIRLAAPLYHQQKTLSESISSRTLMPSQAYYQYRITVTDIFECEEYLSQMGSLSHFGDGWEDSI